MADDEAGVRRLMLRGLERAGFEVLVAEDGQEAVDLFLANKSAIAAVVLNLTMPHKGGVQAYREISQAWPGVPVVLTRGYAEEDVKRHLSAEAPVLFREKPFSVRSLVKMVQSLIPT